MSKQAVDFILNGQQQGVVILSLIKQIGLTAAMFSDVEQAVRKLKFCC